jgi:hypothetical protein
MKIKLEKKTILLIILILAFIIIYAYSNINESWEVYKQKPLGYVKSGSQPLNFYALPRYRKPYRYPFQFTKTAPIEHQSHLD